MKDKRACNDIVCVCLLHRWNTTTYERQASLRRHCSLLSQPSSNQAMKDKRACEDIADVVFSMFIQRPMNDKRACEYIAGCYINIEVNDL